MSKKEIVAKLTLDNAKFSKGMSKTQKDFTKLAATVTGLTAVVAASVISTAKYQDKMIKSARAAGTTSEEFSALAHAADLSGISTEELSKNMTKLAAPTAQTEKEMKKLGIEMKNADGTAKSSGAIMGELANKMQGIKDPMEKSAMAVNIFGQRGNKMVNMLSKGSEGLKQMTDEAQNLGLVVSDETGVAAEKFNDDIAKMQGAMQGVSNTISTSIIDLINQSGVMEDIRDTIRELTQSWNNLDGETQNTIIKVAGITAGISALVLVITGITAIAPAVAAAFTTMFGPVGLVIAGIAAAAIGLNEVLSDTEKVSDNTAATFDKLSETTNRTARETKKLMDIARAGNPIREKYLRDIGFQNLALDQQHRILIDLNNEKNYEKLNARATLTSRIKGLKQEISNMQTIAGLTTDIGINLRENANIPQGIQVSNPTGLGGQQIGVPVVAQGTTERLAQLNKELAEAEALLEKTGKVAPRVFTRFSKSVKKTTKEIKEMDGVDVDIGINKDPFIQSVGQMAAAVLAFDNLPLGEGVKFLTDSFMHMADEASKKAQVVVSAFAGMADNSVKAMQYAQAITDRDNEVALGKYSAKMERELAKTETNEQTRIKIIAKSFDKEIDTLENAEIRKINIIKKASSERLLVLDKEYQSAKQKQEEAFALYMEQEQAKYEAEKELTLQKTVDKEEKQLAEDVIDQDWKSYQEEQEKIHKDNLSKLASEHLAKKEKENNKTKAKLEKKEARHSIIIEKLNKKKDKAVGAAEKVKNDKLEALQDQKNATEKKMQKKALKSQWKAELAAFEATKNTKAAAAMASGISAAAQAYASMAKLGPLGLAAGVGVAAIVMAATTKKVQMVYSQKPIKPAGLYMASGGILSGPAHSQGGISATLEGGEAVIDRVRTEQLFNNIDNRKGGITINIEEGAIQTTGGIDEDVIEQITYEISRKMEQAQAVSL